jgi:uncharacterized RDD family membrane protein YckC
MRTTTFTPYLAPVRKVDVHVTGRRIVATLIDGLVIGSLYGVMTALFGSVTRSGDHAEWRGTLPWTAGVAYALLVIGYYLVLEYYRGQTLGKMVVGIRVIDRATGGRPSLRAVAIRTVLRLVDGFASYLVAFVCALASIERQRLGDRAARTLVVANR